MTTFSTGGSAVTFTTSGSAVSFAVTPASNAFTTSAVLTPGAHASTHGAGGADPITTLGAVAHSGQQTFAAGSAAGPSIAATGDTNTGLYFPAADQVGIATAGTAAITVNATQQVGIKATPSADLHVNGSTADRLWLGAAATTNRILMVRSNGTFGTPTVVAGGNGLGEINFYGYDGSANRLAAQVSGAVDAAPGASDMPGRLVFSTTTDGAIGVTERLRIDSAGQLTTGLGSAGTPVLSFSGDTNTGIYSPGADQVGIATAGTAAVVVTAAGNVGIGTTSAAQRLSVASASSNGIAIDVIGRASDNYGKMRWVNNAVNTVLGEIVHDGTTMYLTQTSNNSLSVSTNNTERMRIDNAGLITGTGTSLGAWTSYTPALGGFTLGDGTWSAAYMRIGKVCVFRAVLTFGSTTTAASAFPTFTLPVTAAGTTNIAMNAQFFDTSASAYYTATSRQSSTTVVTMGILGASGVHTTCTTTTPFTWGVGDQIILSGTYEIA